MVSSALLAAEDPLKADSDRNNVSRTVYIFETNDILFIITINYSYLFLRF